MADLPEEMDVDAEHREDVEKKAMTQSARAALKEKRELEEKRKFGQAPLEVDVVSKQEINPNVPSSISTAPWFYGVEGPTLDHQRLRNAGDEKFNSVRIDDTKYDRVVMVEKAKTFTAGACQNCGSRTHSTAQCYKPKKKVGAVYSGVVSGVDVHLERSTDKSYSQKRDRYIGGSSVDLMRGVTEEAGVQADSSTTGEGNSALKQPRVESSFAATAGVYGGDHKVSRELPKYLVNLDSTTYFDPKTGSMRGNPTESDTGDSGSLSSFQGDLSRYQTGGYYHYLEMQSRFLRKESRSFVDFELDSKISYDQKRKEREAKAASLRDRGEVGATTSADTSMPGEFEFFDEEKSSSEKTSISGGHRTEALSRGGFDVRSAQCAQRNESPVETAIVSALYGSKQSATPTESQKGVSLRSGDDGRDPVGTASAGGNAFSILRDLGLASSARDRITGAPRQHVEYPQKTSSLANPSASTVQAVRTAEPQTKESDTSALPVKKQHQFIFGSFFDVESFSWGFKCCRQVGQDAPGCA